MVAAFAFLLVQRPALGPMLPAGASSSFSDAALAVESALERRDWSAAEGALSALPKTTIKIRWNDTGLPAEERSEWRKQMDSALLRWRQMQNDISLDLSSIGDVEFDFVDQLPVDSGSGLRPAAAFDLQQSPRKLKVVLARKRGPELLPTHPFAIYNEVAYAIGSYLGVADGKLYASVMTRWDLPTERQQDLMPSDVLVATLNLEAAGMLREAVKSKTALTPATPAVAIDPESVDAGRLTQGESTEFSVKLQNSGNAPLSFRIVPDCGCFSLNGVGQIAPGKEARIPVKMDSTMFGGVVKHRLIVLTNDPKRPVLVIPFEVYVTPRYRLISGMPAVQMLDSASQRLYSYLFFPTGKPFNVQQVALSGLPGTVRAERWSGVLADEFMHEPAQPRTGYRIVIDLDARQVQGRAGYSLRIATDDPVYRTLSLSQQVQRGIAALPSQVYFGEVHGARSANLTVSRPGKPFMITSIKAEPPAFQATAKLNTVADELRVEVRYVGGASAGDLMGVVRIGTNDPNQPLLQIPVLAAVR